MSARGVVSRSDAGLTEDKGAHAYNTFIASQVARMF